MPSFRFFILLAMSATCSVSVNVTIHNDLPRLDVTGALVDAHDGMILYHNGVYFLYGECYGNATGSTFPKGWGAAPQLAVYTSPDLSLWTFRGNLFNSSLDTSSFTKWIPNVQWSPACGCFVLWFGSGAWSIATSADGISFTLTSREATSRLGGGTDGTGLFVDDDRVGYVVFAALSTGGSLGQGHLVSIERLTPDLLASSKSKRDRYLCLCHRPSLFSHAPLS